MKPSRVAHRKMRARLIVCLLLVTFVAPVASAEDTCFVVGCVSEHRYDDESCGESDVPPGETFVWGPGVVVWTFHMCGGWLAGEYNLYYVAAGGAQAYWMGFDGPEYGADTGHVVAGYWAPEGLAYAYYEWSGWEWYEDGECGSTLHTSAGDHDVGCPVGRPPTPPSSPAGSVLP